MKGTLLFVNIVTIFAIGECYIECYHCIDGRRGNIPSCSHFFPNPTTKCWNTDYCGKMVELSNYQNFRQVIMYTCFDYEGNIDNENVKESSNPGIRRLYNGMDMEVFICNSTLCNGASSLSSMGLFVSLLLVFFKLLPD